jgi:hypothetical protein
MQVPRLGAHIQLGRSPLFQVGRSPQVISRRDRFLNLYDSDFDEAQTQALYDWGREQHLSAAPAPAFSGMHRTARELYDLFSTRVDLRSSEGLSAFRTLERIGILEGFPADAIRLLVAELGENALANADFLSYLHPTESYLTLAPALECLGVNCITYVCSGVTGQGQVRAVMALQAEATGGKLVHLEATPKNLHHLGGVLLPPGERSTRVPAHPQDYAQVVVDAARSAKSKGRVLIVDRLGPALRLQNPALLEFLREGVIRPIIHNADDAAQLGGLGPQVRCSSLRDSALKHLEAEIIGRTNALFAEREIFWWPHLRQAPRNVDAFVLGYGEIGSNLAQALRKVHRSIGNVTVIDPDAAARARAEKAGFQSVASADEISKRPSFAVVLVASDKTAATAETLRKLGERTLVMSTSTGAAGVDLRGLESFHHWAVRFRGAASDPLFEYALPDMEYSLGEAGQPTARATVLLEGRAPNLHQPVAQDRLVVLPLGLALSAVQACGQKDFGVAVGMNNLEERVLKLFEKHGLAKDHDLTQLREYARPREFYKEL